MSDLLDPSTIIANSLQNPFKMGFDNVNAVRDSIEERDKLAQRDADLQALSENHSPKQILNLVLKYPELSGHIKTAFEGFDTNEQKRRVDATIPIYSAALAGRMDVAKKMLEKQALALENSNGDPEEVARLRDFAAMATEDPESFKNYAGMSLAHGMGADNFGKTWLDQTKAENVNQLTPYQIYSETAKGKKDVADAATKEAVLPFAADTAAAELQNKQYALTDTKADNEVNALNAAVGVQTNTLKQRELNQNLSIKEQERQQKQLDGAQAYETANSTIEGVKSRLMDALSDPALKASPWQRKLFNGVPGSPYKTFDQKLATIQTMNLIPTLAAAKAAGWTGSMSDKDMELLKSELDSLDTALDSKELEKHLTKIHTVLSVAQKRSAKYAKKSEQLGMLPAGTVEPTAPDNNAIMSILIQNGATPQEAAEFLQSRGR